MGRISSYTTATSSDDQRLPTVRYEKDKERRYPNNNKRKYDSESDSDNPQHVVKYILNEFPNVAGDLQQLLRMIDDGQAVDITGLSDESLVKRLRRLFSSLNLKEKGHQVFLLPRKAIPTLDVIGHIISSHVQTNNLDAAADIGPKKRVIGPELPSAELLAKLTEAEAELRDVELDVDDGLFIGPAPPAMLKEAASANEAERFEEITRIIGADEGSPYDVLGINHNMAAENMKKRYWKLSLIVHPDKCSHPQAPEAFVKLNKAFKDLQDPVKRKVLDDKIKEKEDREAFEAELKSMRDAAQWRRLQGISMEGDEALLAQLEVKIPPARDEWMTTLPPERRPATGVSMQATKVFSKTAKEGRGDTSAWTDTPSERAQKAKTNYLEAYSEAAALVSNELEKKSVNSAEAALVDKYNKEKRSKSLMEKHQESTKNRIKKKSKQEKSKKGSLKEEWEENHPWKPWDREKDLAAGRQNVKLDQNNITQGLISTFSSGSFQRNFL